VEKTNIVMVCPNQRVGFAQCNPYAIEVDRRNRNCYNCRRFGYLVRNCRNRETGNRIGKQEDWNMDRGWQQNKIMDNVI